LNSHLYSFIAVVVVHVLPLFTLAHVSLFSILLLGHLLLIHAFIFSVLLLGHLLLGHLLLSHLLVSHLLLHLLLLLELLHILELLHLLHVLFFVDLLLAHVFIAHLTLVLVGLLLAVVLSLLLVVVFAFVDFLRNLLRVIHFLLLMLLLLVFLEDLLLLSSQGFLLLLLLLGELLLEEGILLSLPVHLFSCILLLLLEVLLLGDVMVLLVLGRLVQRSVASLLGAGIATSWRTRSPCLAGRARPLLLVDRLVIILVEVIRELVGLASSGRHLLSLLVSVDVPAAVVRLHHAGAAVSLEFRLREGLLACSRRRVEHTLATLDVLSLPPELVFFSLSLLPVFEGDLGHDSSMGLVAFVFFFFDPLVLLVDVLGHLLLPLPYQ